MAEKRMTCWRCPRYNRDERRCQDGKTNPKNKVDSIAVVELLGLRMLCHYNPYRDILALRWHEPEHPAAVPPPSKRKKRRPLEIPDRPTNPEADSMP
jgi:hypothetical protein